MISQLAERIAALEALAERETEFNKEWRENLIGELENLRSCVDRVELKFQSNIESAIEKHRNGCMMIDKARELLSAKWWARIMAVVGVILTMIGLIIAYFKLKK